MRRAPRSQAWNADPRIGSHAPHPRCDLVEDRRMTRFAVIEARAAKRKGGPQALKKLLSKPQSRAALAKTPDGFLLSLLAKQIFRAGFVWKIVEHKWPGTEEAFAGFEPEVVAGLADHDLTTPRKNRASFAPDRRTETIPTIPAGMLGAAPSTGGLRRFSPTCRKDEVAGFGRSLH